MHKLQINSSDEQISAHFIKDILKDPKTRDVTDVTHLCVAVASSSSAEKAQQFIDTNAPGVAGIKAFGSYDKLLADKDVDSVYIGVPHSLHYPVAKLALEAGKHVLVEKPMTINAKQAIHLAEIAKANNVYLMEGAWTRFFPTTFAIQKALFEDRVIGDLVTVDAVLGHEFPKDRSHRIYDPELGGGALLDLGVYPINWSLILCYNHPDNKKTAPASVSASALMDKISGVDEQTHVTMMWPRINVISTAKAYITADTSTDCRVRITGTLGEIVVPDVTENPWRYIVRLLGQPEYVVENPIPGHGLFYEADQFARDVRDGKKESEVMPLEESVLVQKITDEVREQIKLKFPASAEEVSG